MIIFYIILSLLFGILSLSYAYIQNCTKFNITLYTILGTLLWPVAVLVSAIFCGINALKKYNSTDKNNTSESKFI